MAEKESISISLDKDLKRDIDKIIGKDGNRSDYIRRKIIEIVKNDLAVKEYIDGDKEVHELEQKVAAKRKELAEQAKKVFKNDLDNGKIQVVSRVDKAMRNNK